MQGNGACREGRKRSRGRGEREREREEERRWLETEERKVGEELMRQREKGGGERERAKWSD